MVGKEELEVKRARESPQHFSTTGSRKVTKNARAGEKNLPQVLFSSQKPGEMMMNSIVGGGAVTRLMLRVSERSN